MATSGSQGSWSLPEKVLSMPMMMAIRDMYERDAFTDIEICGEGHQGLGRTIRCHKLVLSSCSPLLREILDETIDQVLLPQIAHKLLKEFVDYLYDQVAAVEPQWNECNQEIMAILQIQAITPHKDLKLVKQVQMGLRPRTTRSSPGKASTAPEEPASWGFADLKEARPKAKATKRPARVSTEDKRSAKPPAKQLKLSRRGTPSTRDERASIMLKNAHFFNSAKTPGVFNVEAIAVAIQSNSGSVPISHTSSPLAYRKRSEELRSLTKLNGVFLALLGVRETPSGDFEGRPLAWTNPDSSEIVGSQFDDAVHVFSDVYGLSPAQLISGRHLIKCQDRSGYSGSQHAVTTKRKLVTSTREQVEKSLKDLDIIKAYSAPAGTLRELLVPLNDWSIELNPDLNAFDDIILVRVAPHAVDGRQIQFTPENLDNFSHILLRILFCVWTGGLAGSKLSFNKHITERYYEIKQIMYRKTAAEELLNSGEELPKKFPTYSCDLCGALIKENVFGNARGLHKKKHLIQDCGCDLGDMGPKDRENHYILKHTTWKVVSCPKCKWLGSVKGLDKHMAHFHMKEMCHECGEVLSSVNSRTKHMEQMHSTYQCLKCSDEISGQKNLRHHYRMEHPKDIDLLERSVGKKKVQTNAFSQRRGEFPCPKCGKVFKVSVSLSHHLKYFHGTEEDKPFSCRLCPKKFFTKIKLKTHLMAIHIQARPFECRSIECKSNFNCAGNLRAHELKFHKKVFGKLPSIHLFVSDDEMMASADVKENFRHRTTKS
eukprot:maker-scaffold11_size778918-snap-gene-6.46 protein:Tk03683 transcript:maker-scaffold11_size778918-snap-gene-6.46-mRNA-1 annotation:"GI20085"